MTDNAVEVNFDGLVGPTHNFAGLSPGNVASQRHAQQASHPKAAALQGIDKMRLLLRLGLTQGVLPPHERPSPIGLAALGFPRDTETAAALRSLADARPWLLSAVMSSSAMWAANAATVSPSADTGDARVHFTPANLISTLHRSFEGPATARVLRRIFADDRHFVVHDPLPSHESFADEGAANHGRFAAEHGQPGMHLFVYGRDNEIVVPPGAFPRRQTLLASQTIAASHGLDPDRTVFVQQASAAIDAGAFHNDVVSVTNGRALFFHQHAFEESIADQLAAVDGLQLIEVPGEQLSLDDAVSSYLFNSQLVTLPDASVVLIAPSDVLELESTREYLASKPGGIDAVHTVSIRESMSNGGGPACLRLRVVLTPSERSALGARVLVDEPMLDQLAAWVERHYRDELRPADLADPQLVDEVRTALDELTQLLALGDLYDFQQ
ncbi:MAG: N-succinylarginine dihydrolase [Acidimicrobiales bacterium]